MEQPSRSFMQRIGYREPAGPSVRDRYSTYLMASLHSDSDRFFYEAEDEIENSEDERLHKLSAFQLTMIKHAMKCAPKDIHVLSNLTLDTHTHNTFASIPTISPSCGENRVFYMQHPPNRERASCSRSTRLRRGQRPQFHARATRRGVTYLAPERV